MSNSRPNLPVGDCARAWCSNNNVPFTCFVSPWLDSLELLVNYEAVSRLNARKAHKEWFYFFKYYNGSQATIWQFDLFINISDSSRHKGAVIVRVTLGKFLVYSCQEFYVFEGLKRKLTDEKYSEVPLTGRWSDCIETDKMYNYYIADDVKYQRSDKCEWRLLDENLRGLIGQAKERMEAGGRMYGYRFHVPPQMGLVGDLLDELVSSTK